MSDCNRCREILDIQQQWNAYGAYRRQHEWKGPGYYPTWDKAHLKEIRVKVYDLSRAQLATKLGTSSAAVRTVEMQEAFKSQKSYRKAAILARAMEDYLLNKLLPEQPHVSAFYSFTQFNPPMDARGLLPAEHVQGTSVSGWPATPPDALLFPNPIHGSPVAFHEAVPTGSVAARADAVDQEALAASHSSPRPTPPAPVFQVTNERHVPSGVPASDTGLRIDRVGGGRAAHWRDTTHGSQHGLSFFQRHPLRDILGDLIGALCLFILLYGLLFAAWIFT